MMDARESKILERDGVDQVFADIGRDESHQDVKEPGQARQALQDIAFGSVSDSLMSGYCNQRYNWKITLSSLISFL